MKTSMKGQEKCDLLIQVTAWAGLTVIGKVGKKLPCNWPSMTTLNKLVLITGCCKLFLRVSNVTFFINKALICNPS